MVASRRRQRRRRRFSDSVNSVVAPHAQLTHRSLPASSVGLADLTRKWPLQGNLDPLHGCSSRHDRYRHRRDVPIGVRCAHRQFAKQRSIEVLYGASVRQNLSWSRRFQGGSIRGRSGRVRSEPRLSVKSAEVHDLHPQ